MKNDGSLIPQVIVEKGDGKKYEELLFQNSYLGKNPSDDKEPSEDKKPSDGKNFRNCRYRSDDQYISLSIYRNRVIISILFIAYL